MREQILRHLAETETAYGIRILFACESGSRAWGFPSPDSDYDVRFLYVHPSERYLGIEELVDEIAPPPDEVMDLKGWDLRKTPRLMRASNATPYEWAQSPIVYREEAGFRERFAALLPQYFSPRTTVQHYLGLARKTWKTALQHPEVRLKKYFYVLRPLMAATWILEKRTVPPMEFAPLLEAAHLSVDVRGAVDRLLLQKADAAESATMPPDPLLHAYIEATLAASERRASEVQSRRGDASAAAHFFREVIHAF